MATIKNFPNNVDENIGASAVMKWLHGRTSGVFGANNNLSVGAVLNSMAVTVSDGIGWLTNVNGDGTVFWNDTEETQSAKLQLSIALADAVLPRIDRVVVSWDTLDYTTKPEIIILKGTAADTPLPPALTNTALKRQLSLAQIRVPAGTSKITSDLITDERLNADVCGLVTESVSVDTTEVQAQFDALLTLVRTELEELNAGTETMLKTTYDPQHKAQDVFAYADSIGTQIYTQIKTGTVHALAGGGANGRMLVTASFAAGDTFTVNGVAVTTVTGADSALTEENLGTWVSFIYDGTQLNFTTGQMQNYVDTKTYTKKIYENASLTSSFLPQTLAFDLIDYDGVDIYYMTSAAHQVVRCTRVLKSSYPARLISSTSILWLRDVTVSDVGIVFENGLKMQSYGATTVDNSGIIPYQIHAFKGVQ